MPNSDLTDSDLLIATGNIGKARELAGLFSGAPFHFKSLSDFPGVTEVPETGSTFLENASLKAVGYAIQTRQMSLADDSGLEVDALGGEPGVLSARFGGDVGFDHKMELVLESMYRSSREDRSARFVCSMVIAHPDGRILSTAEGKCEGSIARIQRGTGGFGYDPIFIPDGFDQTFGELEDVVKAKISHRALAAAKIMRYLLAFKAV